MFKTKNELILLEYVCLDMQGTGPHNKETEEIFEIGAVVIKKGKIWKDTFHRHFKTQIPIPSFINRINSVDYSNSLSFIDKKDHEELSTFIGNRIIVVHNPYPERRLLGKIDKSNNRILILDTLKFAKNIFPNLNSYSLISLFKYLNIDNDSVNNSLSEAKATANVFLKLIDKLPENRQNLEYIAKICAHEIIKDKAV